MENKIKIAKAMRQAFILIYEEHVNIEQLKTRLNKISCKEYAFILHDKDKIKGSEELKKPHIHLYIKFKTPRETNKIINTIWQCNKQKQDPSIYYRFFQETRNSNNAKKYLIHANDKSKYQYNPDEVIATFDYKEWITEVKENDSNDYINETISEYVNGKLNAVELRNKLTPDEYLDNFNTIQNAAKVRVKYIQKNNRDIAVWYITGEAGLGKTTTAKMILEEEYGEGNVYISSSNNDALGDYEGQRGIILDDLRPSTFAYNDLIKLIDNNTSTSVKSRYFNKNIEADTIIITSVFPPDKLYDFEKMGEDTYEQLYRRIKENNIWIDQYRYLRNTDDNSIIQNIALKLNDYHQKQRKNTKKINLENWKMKINKKGIK